MLLHRLGIQDKVALSSLLLHVKGLIPSAGVVFGRYELMPFGLAFVIGKKYLNQNVFII